MRPKIQAEYDVQIGTIPRRRAQAHFHSTADQIVREWLRRRKRPEDGETAHSWFKRNIYRLIKAYVDAGLDTIFISMAKRSGRSLVGVNAISENPFKLALFAMWSDNESLSRHQQVPGRASPHPSHSTRLHGDRSIAPRTLRLE